MRARSLITSFFTLSMGDFIFFVLRYFDDPNSYRFIFQQNESTSTLNTHFIYHLRIGKNFEPALNLSTMNKKTLEDTIFALGSIVYSQCNSRWQSFRCAQSARINPAFRNIPSFSTFIILRQFICNPCSHDGR